ncbi:TetR/AcrR family transcriptional regulator [Miniphocaeibacter massiliensis]|uniref:TetR/AcrR family transcriptional regulator n=1 Tax=Miniphocaeibacter massiliensis TaxID=2041841 RepID=UPI000C1C0428|nr:TetR/AcrR family transcriptional regulator [Miniphocaeibacter massiliensis]
MTKRNTKEIILIESLNLFARKGYDGVSVRDIAGKVGIKQSSLYKHYKNKQDIFDNIVLKMEEKFNDISKTLELPEGDINEIARKYGGSGIDILKKISRNIFVYYLKDSYASKFRKMLNIEKYKNKDIEQIYRKVYIDIPISYQKELFNEMIFQGFMKDFDSKIMALQFYAPIFTLLNKYDGIVEKEDEALTILDKHIEQFDKLYRKEKIN